MDFLNDLRFVGIRPFENKVWLSSPTMHGDEQKWVDEAIRTNWVCWWVLSCERGNWNISTSI